MDFNGEMGMPILNVETEKQELKHDLNTLGYVLKVLDNMKTVCGERVQFDENRLSGALQDIMKHSAESGGSGSEALSRLMAIGVIEEMPQYQVEKVGREADDSIPESNMTIKEILDDDGQKTGEKELYLELQFLAYLPEDGVEMWNGEKSHQDLCSTQIVLKFPKEGLDSDIDMFRKKHSDINLRLNPNK